VELLLTRGKMRLPEILEAMNVADDTRETAVFWKIQLGSNSS
jgi:hypothetical protein